MIRKSDLQKQIDSLYDIVADLDDARHYQKALLQEVDDLNCLIAGLDKRLKKLEKTCACKAKKKIPVKKVEKPADKLEVAVGTVTMAFNKEALTKKTICCATEKALDKAIEKQKAKGYKVVKTAINKKGQYVAILEK